MLGYFQNHSFLAQMKILSVKFYKIHSHWRYQIFLYNFNKFRNRMNRSTYVNNGKHQTNRDRYNQAQLLNSQFFSYNEIP